MLALCVFEREDERVDAARLWEIGLPAGAGVFGAMIGLFLGLGGLRPRVGLALIAGCGLLFHVLMLPVVRHLGTQFPQASKYNYVLFLAAGVVVLWAGLRVLREEDRPGSDPLQGGWARFAAPCFACFGAAFSVLFAAGASAPGPGVLEGAAARCATAALVAGGGGAFLLAGRTVRFLRRPYPVLLGHLMLSGGFCFLVLALVVPQLAYLDGVRFAPLLMPSLGDLCGLGAVTAVLLGLGVWLGYRRRLLQ